MTTVTLLTKDQTRYEIERSRLRDSKVLTGLLNEFPDATEIPIPLIRDDLIAYLAISDLELKKQALATADYLGNEAVLQKMQFQDPELCEGEESIRSHALKHSVPRVFIIQHNRDKKILNSLCLPLDGRAVCIIREEAAVVLTVWSLDKMSKLLQSYPLDVDRKSKPVLFGANLDAGIFYIATRVADHVTPQLNSYRLADGKVSLDCSIIDSILENGKDRRLVISHYGRWVLAPKDNYSEVMSVGKDRMILQGSDMAITIHHAEYSAVTVPVKGIVRAVGEDRVVVSEFKDGVSISIHDFTGRLLCNIRLGVSQYTIHGVTADTLFFCCAFKQQNDTYDYLYAAHYGHLIGREGEFSVSSGLKSDESWSWDRAIKLGPVGVLPKLRPLVGRIYISRPSAEGLQYEEGSHCTKFVAWPL